LIRILQLAYSGERAAGYAYRGHWRSCSEPSERERIRQIEDEEWHHRELVGGLLRELGARPSRYRELRAILIGRAIQFLCHVTPWFVPMYGAGRLESGNIKEYEDAARLARTCGRADFLDCLLSMAEVEWDHERYFREKVQGHAWTRVFRLWVAPPPRETIRR
jgi:rubrerythrin